jgi:TRAP-type C4-dicarboxylate transport system substrate-binding protein
MKGLKIRVPDAPPGATLFPRAVGPALDRLCERSTSRCERHGRSAGESAPIDAKKFYEVQSHINLTAHITDALLTIIGGPLWAKLSESDRKTFEAVYKEAAVRATGEIVEIEGRLAGEFAKRGKTVVKVDRLPFMDAVQKYYQSGKLPDGNALPWPRETYDQLQAIR